MTTDNGCPMWSWTRLVECGLIAVAIGLTLAGLAALLALLVGLVFAAGGDLVEFLGALAPG